MFNQRMLSILKRELKDKILSRTFIVMTLLVPLFMVIILALPTYLMTMDKNDNFNITVITENNKIADNLKTELGKIESVKEGKSRIKFLVKDENGLKEYLKENKQKILNENITGVIYLPKKSAADKRLKFYSNNPNNKNLFNQLKGSFNQVLTDNYFSGKNLSEKDVKYARTRVFFDSFRISKDASIKAESKGNRIISFLLTFLLYFSLIYMGTMVMRSVVEEKNSKIVEVILSSVSSKELMTGKILGAAITGLLQMIIWLTPLILLISTSIFIIPAEFALQIDMPLILYFLFNFFIGLITFLGLFATVGSIFDNDQDAQSGIWPLMMLVIIPFFIAIAIQDNPNNSIGYISSMFPFASIIVMPAKMSLIDVPLWQILISVVVNLGTMFGIFILAGKVYRVGILSTGKKPKWSEVIKWLKYKY
ncbi:MAG TPA: ABC transporter permease [Ignavibacteria bacterium]|nr:ABC transporter permease [Ignavibacteria bacterium]